MLRSPYQNPKIATRTSQILAALLTAVSLVFPTLDRLSGHGLHLSAGVSIVSAAEPLKADKPAPASEDELSDHQVNEKPAAISNDRSNAIEYFPRPTKYDAKIIEALDKPTRVEFNDLPLEDALGFLKDFHKFNLWLDRLTLADEGVALDQPVTLKMAGVTLRSVLKLLLEPMQLSYAIEDGVMKITTSTKMGEKLVTRTYPVHDLYRGRIIAENQPRDDNGAPRDLRSESRPGDLEIAIAKTIEPDSWDDKRGPASMTYIEAAGSLVIRQTLWAHDQILDLLRDLREAKRAMQGAPHDQATPPAGFKLRGRRRDETYSLVGIMDLDGDGEDDSDRLRRLINAIGASIDNEIDEKGNLRVDGKIPDEYKPCLTEKTKFVIVGRIPQASDSSDPDEIATSIKISGLYKDLEDQARAQGVRIIRLDDFLRYIGYEPLGTKAGNTRQNGDARR
jgi:hypothetical protein